MRKWRKARARDTTGWTNEARSLPSKSKLGLHCPAPTRSRISPAPQRTLDNIPKPCSLASLCHSHHPRRSLLCDAPVGYGLYSGDPTLVGARVSGVATSDYADRLSQALSSSLLSRTRNRGYWTGAQGVQAKSYQEVRTEQAPLLTLIPGHLRQWRYPMAFLPSSHYKLAKKVGNRQCLHTKRPPSTSSPKRKQHQQTQRKLTPTNSVGLPYLKCTRLPIPGKGRSGMSIQYI